MSQTSKFSSWSCCLAIVVGLYLLGFTSTTCDAQIETPLGGKQYKQLPINKDFQNSRSEIRRMLRGEITPGAAEAKLRSYYKGYFFPRWTLPENAPQLPSFRNNLQASFDLARNPNTYSTLLQIALDNLTPLAKSPDYHPTVRFNAAVMLGRLNAKYTPKKTTPEAYTKSLPMLLALLEDQSENDAARFGALLGVVRHAKFNKDAASHPKIIDVLLKQATDQKVPTNRPSEGHEWFRTTAIEGLAHAKNKQVSKVAPALAKIINDATETNSLRQAAANSLGKLTLTPASGTDSAVTTRSLAELASQAVRKEIEACEKDENKTIDPNLLMSQLLPIRVALTGYEKKVSSPQKGLAAATNDKPFLQKVWKLTDAWYSELDNKDLIPDETDPMDDLMEGEKPPARVATEELIEYFKLELQKMDNLLGIGGNLTN